MIDIDFPSAETKTGAGGRRMMGERGCGGGGGGRGGGGGGASGETWLSCQ